jgi:hypothetical protein
MCHCPVDIFKMHTYANKEYADIHFVYGSSDENATAGVQNKRYFPNQ